MNPLPRWLVALVVFGMAGVLGCANRPGKRDEQALPAETDKDVAAVVEKALMAHAADKLTMVKAFFLRVEDKTVVGTTMVTDFSWQRPDKWRRESLHERNGKKVASLAVYNAGIAWSQRDGETKEASGRWVAYTTKYLGPLKVFQLRDGDWLLSALGESKDGERAVGLGLTSREETGLQERWYFDQGTGLLTRVETVSKAPDREEVRVEALYEEYEDFGGIPVARKVTHKSRGKVDGVTKVLDFKVVDQFDPKLFEKP